MVGRAGYAPAPGRIEGARQMQPVAVVTGASSGIGAATAVKLAGPQARYHAILAARRLELCGEPVRVIEVAPGMVRTEEFALNRYHGDAGKAAAVYAGVSHPLTAEDIADTVTWAVTRPSHVNVDLLVIRPRAQAA